MSARLVLNMSVEDGVMCAAIDIPGFDAKPLRGTGATLLEAVEHLHAQLKCPEYEDARMCIGDEKMTVLEKLIEDERHKKQIRDEVTPFERMGIREAWAFTKSDLKDKVFIVAVPPITQHQHAQVVEQLHSLLEGLFPDEQERPVCTVLPDDFVLGTREPEETPEEKYEEELQLGAPVTHRDVPDVIRQETRIVCRVVDQDDNVKLVAGYLQLHEDVHDDLPEDVWDRYGQWDFCALPDDEQREIVLKHCRGFKVAVALAETNSEDAWSNAWIETAPVFDCWPEEQGIMTDTDHIIEIYRMKED